MNEKYFFYTHLYFFGGDRRLGLLLELVLVLQRGRWPTGLRGADDGSRAVHGLHIFTHIQRSMVSISCAASSSYMFKCRKSEVKSWYSLCWPWPAWEGLLSGCLWWSGLIAGLKDSPLITGDGASFSSFNPPWLPGALCYKARKWRHTVGPALNRHKNSVVHPEHVTHLFGLHVVRWRRVRHRRILGELWGMHHERGWVVPHVTCQQNRGTSSFRQQNSFVQQHFLLPSPVTLLSFSQTHLCKGQPWSGEGRAGLAAAGWSAVLCW